MAIKKSAESSMLEQMRHLDISGGRLSIPSNRSSEPLAQDSPIRARLSSSQSATEDVFSSDHSSSSGTKELVKKFKKVKISSSNVMLPIIEKNELSETGIM